MVRFAAADGGHYGYAIIFRGSIGSVDVTRELSRKEIGGDNKILDFPVNEHKEPQVELILSMSARL